MDFFEKELKKLVGESECLKDKKYVGRSCIGVIGGNLRARIQFVTLGVADQYAAVKTSIINKNEGVVDSLLLSFSDEWGRKKVDNPNFKEGLIPHIWMDCGKYEWYVYKPNAADYRQLTKSIEEYISMFQDMGMEQEGQGMIQQRM